MLFFNGRLQDQLELPKSGNTLAAIEYKAQSAAKKKQSNGSSNAGRVLNSEPDEACFTRRDRGSCTLRSRDARVAGNPRAWRARSDTSEHDPDGSVPRHRDSRFSRRTRMHSGSRS